MKFTPEKINKEKLIEDLFESPFLNNFFIDNDLTSEQVEENLLTFLTYNTEKNYCLECKGLHVCKQDQKGLEPILRYENNKVLKLYKECNFLKFRRDQENQEKHIDAMHLPSSVLHATLEDYDFNRGENRVEIMNKMTTFITLYKNGDRPKGIYIYGRNNIGKTYSLSALANELMKNKIKVIIAYYPDLVREFKSRVNDNSVESLVSKLKQIDVLMLDDIGGEGKSVWVRDEILGPILQYRLLDHKPTFFSSNFPIKLLAEEHFSKFTGGIDKVSGARIGTRIKNLVGENEFKL